jgi:hypothetical protein
LTKSIQRIGLVVVITILLTTLTPGIGVIKDQSLLLVMDI